MNPEEYAAQQAAISAAIANYALQFGQLVTQTYLSVEEWLMVLRLMFPEVQRRREEAAALARLFYDSQRDQFYPELPRNDRFLEGYQFEWFVENMEPAREKMSQVDSPADALGTFALRAVREVENAGRKQIIHAVENDPAPSQVIRGWARVATGEETCAWCLMLISRGPTYLGNRNAGLDLTEAETLAAYRDAPDLQTFFDAIEEHIDQWHDGCDCKVVPVFKREDWFGEDAAKRALELWNDASKVADQLRLIDPSPPRVHKAGQSKGDPFTRNEDVINVLRSMLENGEIDTSEFAALAA